MREFTIGGIACQVGDDSTEVSGNSMSGEPVTGQVIPAVLHTPDGGHLEIGLTRWSDGSMDLRAFTRLAGPVSYDRLAHGVRMGIYADGNELWCELRVLKHGDPNSQPTMVQATWEVFDTLLGEDAQQALTGSMGVRLGTREELFDETNRRRNELALACLADDRLALFKAYVLTRVVPTYRGYGKAGVIPVGKAQ